MMMFRKMSLICLTFVVFAVTVEAAVTANWTKIEREENDEIVVNSENNDTLTNETPRGTIVDHSTETPTSEGTDLLCWKVPIDENCSVCPDESEFKCFLKGTLRYLIFALIIIAAFCLPFFFYWVHKSQCKVSRAYSEKFKEAFLKGQFTKMPMQEQI